MSKHKDKIKGGKADKKQPKDFDKDQLAIGTAHEMEHTNNSTLAQEIAMDHLTEDSNYYKKLKAVEKYDRVDEEKDGKRELDYGKEDLEKPMRKSLFERWEAIKKNLDNQSAILDLGTFSEEEDEDGQSDEEGQSAHPEWLPEEVPHDDQQQGSGEDEQEEDPDEQSGPSEELDEGLEEGDEEETGEEQPGDDDEHQELIEALQQMGHSDSEIAHIVHGHMTPPIDEAKRAKAHAEYAGIDHDKEAHDKEMTIRDQEAQVENDHAKRMKDVEYQRAQKEAGASDLDLDHQKRMLDLEYQKAAAESKFNEAAVESEHKKRMLELEYEVAKQQKAIELEYKKKELEMKLKHSEQLAVEKHKTNMATSKEDAKFKMDQKKQDLKMKAQDKAADRKKVKKSEDEEESLRKIGGWAYNPKTGQVNHPDHGSILVRPGTDHHGFDILHNGNVVGNHESHEGIKSMLQGYLQNYGKPVTGTVTPGHQEPRGSTIKPAKSTIESDYPFPEHLKLPAEGHKFQSVKGKDGKDLQITPRNYAEIPDRPKKVT